MLQRPSTPHAGSCLSTTYYPPPCLAPQASQVPPPQLPAFVGTHVRIRLFLFLFFVSFLTNVTETLFTPGPKAPASPPHNTHPRASPLKPCKSPPPLPHRTQARGLLHLRHMQVHCHRHPVTARKIRPRRRLATCKARRDDIPTWHARPATTPTCRAQAPPWCHLNTERKTPTPPTRRAQAPLWRHPNTERKAPLPPTSRDANTSHRTPPPRHPQHGMQNGAAVGTVAVVDSGMTAARMAAT